METRSNHILVGGVVLGLLAALALVLRRRVGEGQGPVVVARAAAQSDA